MVKVNKQPEANIFCDFLHLIEEEAARFPVELITIAEETGGGPQALLVMDCTLSAKRKGELTKALCTEASPATERERHSALPDRTAALPGAEFFKDLVQAELARVKKSRLPCSLLLIRIDGNGEDRGFFNKAAAALEMAMEGDHHLAHLDHTTLALLLPGQNRNRALRQAGAIQQLLTAEITARVKIGLAVCLARAVPAAEEFMEMAFTELQKAEHEAGDIFYSFPSQDEDSCQVTAEERAQLFSFLNKGNKE
ncbi:MAG: hypothetical protein KKC76_01385 [Proteobacteria bacterium]|nr:hypothetical protein [Pseudomonadota bacterium]MBU4298189.1 hypothetical protein [Pseudomonadota bacterium]MCG2748106.1 hypothetical protein [Desulfobulbaceae bacterium]